MGINWHSTCKKSLGELINENLSDTEKDIFYMLFNGYGMKQKLQSSFFELCRVGDGKYTLIVQKHIDNSWSVKFSINNNYKNKAERYA